jgi:hypothetical protein
MSQYRTKLLLLSHNFSNVIINSNSLNEARYISYMLQQLMQEKYTRIKQADFPLFQAKETNKS